jgi:hypothetical protein
MANIEPGEDVKIPWWKPHPTQRKDYAALAIASTIVALILFASGHYLVAAIWAVSSTAFFVRPYRLRNAKDIDAVDD